MIDPGVPRRDNAFDLIRLIAAAVVIYAHSPEIAGRRIPVVAGFPVGLCAVAVFFATSGYLLTASWQSDPRLGVFLWKRCLRILPALIPLALVLAVLRHADVFDGNPHAALDQSLWSLPVEVRCYLLLAVVGAIGLMRRPGPIFVSYLAIVLVFMQVRQPAAWSGMLDVGAWLIKGTSPRGLGLEFAAVMAAGCFLGGMLVHHLPRRRWLALASLLAVLFVRPSFAAMVLGFPYLVIYLGESRTVRLRRDLSYGIYIWGWPVQQTIVALGIVTPLVVFPLALAATTLIASVSWAVVERPALRLKRRPRRGPEGAAPVRGLSKLEPAIADQQL